MAFNVPQTTLQQWIGRITSQAEKNVNCQKLSNTEESTLSEWILDMDRHGLPLQLSIVHYLAQLFLTACLSSLITLEEHWVN